MSRISRFDCLLVVSETFKQLHYTDEELLVATNCTTFLSLFSEVSDARQQHKIKYKLSDLLGMIFFVILKERTCAPYAIASHIEEMEPELSEYGLIHDHQCPSHDTILRVLEILDSKSLLETTIVKLAEILQSLEDTIPGSKKHNAFDGKEVCGTGRSVSTKNPKPNIGTLNVFDTSLGTCIQMMPIENKESEIPAVQSLLGTMNLKGTYFTADALHCQRETCKIINNGKGFYVFTVKDNQPSLNEEITAKMDKYREQGKTTIYDIDGKTIEILPLPKGYATDGFAGMKTFARLTSTRKEGGVPVVRNFISNSKDDELICDAILLRWGCETHHWQQDTFFNHDAITYTSKTAVYNATLLLNLALQLITLYHTLFTEDMRKAKIAMHHHPVECINKVLSVMTSEEIIEDLKKHLKTKSFK